MTIKSCRKAEQESQPTEYMELGAYFALTGMARGYCMDQIGTLGDLPPPDYTLNMTFKIYLVSVKIFFFLISVDPGRNISCSYEVLMSIATCTNST